MIIISVDVNIYCESAWPSDPNKIGKWVKGCYSESSMSLSITKKSPMDYAMKEWKKQGWLITKDKTYCPHCAKQLIKNK